MTSSACTSATGSSCHAFSDEQQAQIGDGVLSLDVLTRKYIREHFKYRYVTLPNGKDAFALEREVQRGALAVGKPFLNPV